MKRVFLFLALILILLSSVTAASSIDEETMNSGDTAEISAKVYLNYTEEQSSGNRFAGFSLGAPDPNTNIVLGWSGTLHNPYDSDIQLSTAASASNPAEIKGVYPGAENTNRIYIWLFNDDPILGSLGSIVLSVGIRRMTSEEYGPGLDFSLKMVPMNRKTNDIQDAEITISTSSDVNEKDIFKGDYKTRIYGDMAFNKNDFEYWSIDIETAPLPEDVPAGASFTGSLIVEFKAV